MKRTKSLFALLVATVLALALVPGVAFGENDDIANYTDTGQSGVLGTTKGTITLQNAKAKETYKVYRLFELASFVDEDPATGQHGTNDQDEAYSYVIAKTDTNVASWYTFLTTYGPGGSSDNNKYAILSNADGAASNTSAYFIIDSDPVTIIGNDGTTYSTYYCIRKNPNNSTFKNTYDDLSDATARDASGGDVSGPTTPHGPGDTKDYANEANYSAVQNFAQEALKYAASESLPDVATVIPTTNGSQQLLPEAPLGYYLVGTTMGTLASLDTTNPDISIYEKNDEPEIEKKVLKKGATIPITLTPNYLIGAGVADGDWCVDTDADIGDYVQFRTVITAQQGADRYKLHDVMEDGFTFVNEVVSTSTTTDIYNAETEAAASKDYTVKVYLVTNETPSKIYIVDKSIAVTSGTAKENWTLNYVGDGVTEGDPTDGCDFELSINDWGGSAAGNNKVTLAAYRPGEAATEAQEVDIKDGDKIVVTYWARLNERAVIFNKGNVDNVETAGTNAAVATNQGTADIANQPKKDKNTDQRNTNSTILTYGANGYTAWRTSTVSTFQFDVVKTNEYNGTTTHLLKDAKFSLYKATALDNDATVSDEQINGKKYRKGANALVFTENANNVYSFAGDAVTTAGSGKVNQLTSASDHEIHLEGLEAGTYLLYEDVAPKGYNKLSHPILITIQNGDYSGTATDDEGMISSVFTNNAGTATTTPSSGFAAWDATVGSVTGGASTYTSTGNGGIQIVNQTGQELPSTGGLGTKAFYAIGGSLFAASVIFLTTKKRLKQAA